MKKDMCDSFILYWVDKTCPRKDKYSQVKFEVLNIETSHRYFQHAVTDMIPCVYNHTRNAAEVIRKGDIMNFIAYLKGQGFKECKYNG